MKTKYLGIALLASASAMSTMYQDASAASYTYNGVEYTWTCYGETCRTGSGSTYIDQYQIYVLPGDGGVDYLAKQVGDLGVLGGSLTAIGFYENELLSSYLDRSSAAITDSGDGVLFNYDPDGVSFLPEHDLIFSSEDSPNSPANGLNVLDEWVNINFAYADGKAVDDFSTNAMFSPDHYIFVHLQSTLHPLSLLDDSEKWLLTWEDEGGGGEQEVPEPAITGLIGIGLFSLALASARKVPC